MQNQIGLLARLFEGDPGARLLVVGRGTHRRTVAEEPAQRMGLGDRVIFAGYRKEDYAEVLRTTGFAFAPAVLFPMAALLPDPVGIGIALLGRAWILVAIVVAVRQALDFTTLRALGAYGGAILLMWLVLWGLVVVPVPGT